MFHGFDFDNTMLRIGSMNMLLHGVENPDIRYRDSLAQDHAGEEEKYTLVLANPPFAGSLDYENTAKDLLQIVKTKKTELLFLALFLRLLKPGGRAAVIVPDGVLFGSSNAHKELRRMLVEDQKLDAVVSLPGGVFRPYAGVSTAILLFTKTNSGGTDHVWFYDVRGRRLEPRRQAHAAAARRQARPRAARPRSTADEHAKNNLPDMLARWAAARRRRTRAPAHRAELLRAQGRHRRPGLRPLAQPLQGSGARGGRAPPAEGDPRRPREAGGGDPAGDEGAGGDAEVSAAPDDRARRDHGDRGRVRLTLSKFSGRESSISTASQHSTVANPKSSQGAQIGSAKQIVEPGDVLLSKIVPTSAVPGSLARTEADGSLHPASGSCSAAIDCIRPGICGMSWSAIRFTHSSCERCPVLAAHCSERDLRMSPSIRVPLPPLPEQRRIAEILDKADALRAKRRAALAQLDTLTQSIFLDMFGDPTTNPKGWPTKKLGRVAPFLTSGSVRWSEHYAEDRRPLSTYSERRTR